MAVSILIELVGLPGWWSSTTHRMPASRQDGGVGTAAAVVDVDTTGGRCGSGSRCGWAAGGADLAREDLEDEEGAA